MYRPTCVVSYCYSFYDPPSAKWRPLSLQHVTRFPNLDPRSRPPAAQAITHARTAFCLSLRPISFIPMRKTLSRLLRTSGLAPPLARWTNLIAAFAPRAP
jgi:hypothetical protein